MLKLKMLLGAVVLSTLSGCAHQIVIAPDVAKINPTTAQVSSHHIGYVISDADRVKQVITPGGGGDKVSYTPYKDIEPALFKVLSNSFARAYPIKSATDADAIKQNNISYVFIPELTTNSSSTSLVTWPPTDFTIDLNSKIVDSATNAVVWQKHLSAHGQSEFKEFVHDLSLTGKRASLQLMNDLQAALDASPELHK